MKTFAEIIKNDFKKVLAGIAILIAAFAVGFSYYNLRETVAQEKILILNFAATITKADLMQNDILGVDKDLGRFEDTLLRTNYPHSRIGVWLNDRKIGSFGPQRPFNFPVESFEETTSVSRGDTIRIQGQISEFNYILWSLFSLLLLEGLLFWVFKKLEKKIGRSAHLITEPLSTMVAKIHKIAVGLPASTKERLPLDSSNISEIGSLSHSINTLLGQILTLQSDLEKINIDRGRLQVAEYVHHNVMGPIGTLEMIANNFTGLSGAERGSLLNAIGRIRDTIVTLDTGNKEKGSVHVPSVLEMVLAEKRIRYREKAQIEIVGSGLQIYDAFISGAKSELSAIVSNLIDNSVEAMKDFGQVKLSLLCSKKEIEFKVQDTGIGFPKDILEKLGSSRISHGKNGKGLGLLHAKETVTAWGGKIEFAPPNGSGATVTVTIPRASPPEWFAPELAVEPGTEIIVIDDDPIIHEVWNHRLTNLGDVTITHFTTPTEFRQSMQGRDLRYEKRVYLMDYEFKGFEETGLDLIRIFKIKLESFLVTGRHNDEKVLDGVKKLRGLRQIPKEFMDRVAIRLDRDTIESQGTGYAPVLVN